MKGVLELSDQISRRTSERYGFSALWHVCTRRLESSTHSTMASQSNKSSDEVSRLREECGRFRVLIIGRANAGKTTICQKMCNETDPPVVYDRNGKEV
jgi:predicted GTPase